MLLKLFCTFWVRWKVDRKAWVRSLWVTLSYPNSTAYCYNRFAVAGLGTRLQDFKITLAVKTVGKPDLKPWGRRGRKPLNVGVIHTLESSSQCSRLLFSKWSEIVFQDAYRLCQKRPKINFRSRTNFTHLFTKGSKLEVVDMAWRSLFLY